jgi:hypothetical protein
LVRQIIFSTHAIIKLQILNKHGFKVGKEDIINIVKHPDKVIKSRKGRFVAQKVYNEKHLVRVIYEVMNANIVVVTFYPARKERYENKV